MVWYRGTTRFIILFILPLTSYLYDAIVGLADVCIDGDGTDAVGYDVAAGGVLDVLDMSTDICLDGGVLKDTVAGLVEGTVFQYEVLRITQQLFTREMAVDQTDILRVPGEIFAIEIGIINRDILALPERVLRQDIGMMHLYILTILEHVFRIALKTIDIDVLREHKGISTTMQLYILDLNTIYLPESFISIGNLHILECQVVHLAEELGPVDTRILHHHIVGIPDG